MPSEAESPKLSIDVVVTNTHGMHLRCCNEVARIAMGFSSRITIGNNRRKADAKSMLGLTTLAAPCGSHVTVTASGADAAAALTAIKDYFANTSE